MSKDYIPSNVTRQANLPPTDFTLIAIAPWINVECTQEYLSAARQDPNKAFIFYLPDNGTQTPPPPSSLAWDLRDGGAWKTQYQYPVYTIPGFHGDRLMRQLSLYSGNMTSVPHGHQISELPGIDPRDYVRLYTAIDNANSSTLPQFWVLLLLVIAVLIVILGLISAAMHLIQRARRSSLRRRVASGEVNLEALGIKRLTVPQDCIDRLPLFIYSDESEKFLPSSPLHIRSMTASTLEKKARNESSTSNNRTALPETIFMDDSTSTRDSVLAHKFLPYSQPTCPICLDDYESEVTEIRELSCGHIFHPECIDTFLGSSSSLCPLCKKSALPPGYCPTKVTNAMVRRERNLRRLRARIVVDDSEASADSGATSTLRSRFKKLKLRLQITPIFDPQPGQELSPVSELPLFGQQPIFTGLPTRPQASVLGNEVSDRPSRREVVEQRIRDLAAGQAAIQDPDVINDRRRLPKC